MKVALLYANNLSCGVNSLETESDEDPAEGERRPVSRVCQDISTPSSSTSDFRGGQFTSSSIEDLPLLPPSFEDTPPKPPDRPPKKVNLRSLFHPSTEEPVTENAPSRPYFFRKPPAPDPPITPPESPPVISACSGISRSSTPDLPPPPPPPPAIAEETVVCDEPLPPPPQPETQSEGPPTSSFSPGNDKEVETPAVTHHTSPPPKPPHKETYHKDSYMAHRKDWKTGYEGRYRRTHSPCAPDRTGGVHSTSRENLINFNNNNNNNNKSSHSKSGSHATTYHTAANLRCALSTSSLIQRPASPVENLSFLSEKNAFSNGCPVARPSKGWSPHMRQKSTTVNFTSEELRAFKARRAAQESMLSSTGDLNYAGSSPSPLRPLTRAFSMGEPFHVQSGEENGDSTSDDASDEPLTDGSSNVTPAHDGPITAHPAQVTEETTSSSTSAFTSLPLTSLSKDFTQSLVLTTSQPSLSPPTSPVALSVTSSTSSLASASSSSSSSTLVSSKHAPVVPSSLAAAAAASTSYAKIQCDKIDYRRALSSTGTCPSMTLPTLSPDEASRRANIVVLKYGRAPKPEIVACDQLSLDFAQMGIMDSRLQALLDPRPPYKSMASYMDGIFALEMRKDLLCQSHADHPDFNANSILEDSHEDGDRRNLAEEPISRACNTTVAGDSLCFTSSESKLWPTARENPVVDNLNKSCGNNQVLREMKEELTNSIGRKLDALREEQSVVREEISQNSELGLRVTEEVELRAKSSEADKIKLHVEEIDKITSLLLGLSGRLAKVENSLILVKHDEQKRILEGKKDKLSDQLEEAKRLKENIDRRAVQISKILTKYLTEEEYAEYDHFVKMKAKLIMDAREVDEEIKHGEEQLHALQNLVLPL